MPIRFVAMIAIVALLAGCGGRPIGVMTPTGQTVAGTTPVNLLVA
ncbi:MAG TPA: esterase, partial [Agrobacterium sp.]|nr:esterase [Agrobacterium sp.]